MAYEEGSVDLNDNKKVLDLIVASGDIPQYIYKYTSLLALIKILRSGKIHFSKPSDFNDPFDCNLTIDTNNTDPEIDEYIRELKIKKNLSESQVKKIYNKMSDPLARFELTNTSIKQMKESFGVSCFSKKSDNLIMWAHYADKHKGVVIKFNILEDTDFFMTPFPIKYESIYPAFNYLRNRAKIGKFLLETKSLDWLYEGEIRIMKEGSGLYKIKKSALVEIIFGCRVSEKEKRNIVKIVDTNKYSNIKFNSSQMDLRDFKLNFYEYLPFRPLKSNFWTRHF